VRLKQVSAFVTVYSLDRIGFIHYLFIYHDLLESTKVHEVKAKYGLHIAKESVKGICRFV
jgi:hypothetical protein